MNKRKCRSGKVRYSDREAAIAALHLIQSNGSRCLSPTRAYMCQWCNGHHLTSQSQDDHECYKPVAGLRIRKNAKPYKRQRRVENE